MPPILDTDDRFRLADLDEPAPGEVAIRVAYAGIQYGDVLLRDGHFPRAAAVRPRLRGRRRIIAVGEGVAPARVGENVTALTGAGAYAEVVVAPAALTLDAEGLTPRTAAGFGWVTPAAYDLINTVTRVRAGDRVLIHAAAGGVGTLAVRFATAAGAGRIVGVVGNPAKAGHAARLADGARRALRLVTDGHVRVEVTAEYDLADLDQAIERLATGATTGKSVLRVA